MMKIMYNSVMTEEIYCSAKHENLSTEKKRPSVNEIM